MIKVQDLAYVRFGVPDLDLMERFAADFGLTLAARVGDTLYHRGTGPSAYCHVAELGEAGFRGLAFEAASASDLEAAAKIEGASPVEKLDAPGGGQRVRLRDPDGHVIEIVYGREEVAALPVMTATGVNRGSEKQRLGIVHRPPSGPSSVKRLGHSVLKVADFAKSKAWYQGNLGLLSSDEIYLGAPENVLSVFMRCDLGDAYTDHHTLAIAQIGEPGLEHAAFEVEDIDSLMAGHHHLTKAEYTHHAGVGRHILGSQIFDYWKDPWGHTVEHYADGDLLNARSEPQSSGAEVALGTLWGAAPAPG
jgi:catechol 2,3-dioxygenase-like lactoylglutathione lyase family enzyme